MDNDEKDLELLRAIDDYAEQATGSRDDGELSRQRALSLDAYSGKIIDVAPEGRSEVQDRSLFETVSWIMPSLMRIFAGGSRIVEFDPFGPEDEDVAEQESEVLNYYVTQKNDWDLLVRTWCQDALITKNAYVMVDMENKLRTEVERYEGQSEEQISLLLEEDVEVVGQKQYQDPDDEGSLLNPQTGQPVESEEEAIQVLAMFAAQGEEPQMVFKQLYDVELRSVKASKNLRFRVLPPERCKVAEDTTSFDLSDCDYFEYDELVKISDLRSLGYEIDDDIASDDLDDTEEANARDYEYSIDRDLDLDGAMRQVMVRTVWIRHDYDEDGIAEMQKVVRVGEEILEHEPASRIPVACIVPFINTHRHVGMSVSDLVFDVQRIKSTLLRSGIDSLYLANNPRHAISNKVNLDDLLVSRPGGVVRLKDGAVPGEGHIMPLQTENTFPNARDGLLHMDTVIEARVGVNKMFQGIDSSNLNAHDRVGQLSTMAAQRVEDIARLFGIGFKRLFSIAHELMIKSGHQGETIKLRGQWMNVDPTQWRTGRDMRVVAPFAAGNKDSLLSRLMIVASIHEKALAAGLPIVDTEDAYNLALEIGKAADLPATKFFTDPTTVPPPEPAPDYTAVALQIEDKKAENEAIDEERKAEIEVGKIKSNEDVEKYKADLNAELQITLAKLNAGKSIDLETVRARLKGSSPESFDGLKETIKQISDAIDKIKESETAPIKIVRKKGKIIGRERNGVFTPLEDMSA
jgi:hypothetical protein